MSATSSPATRTHTLSRYPTPDDEDPVLLLVPKRSKVSSRPCAVSLYPCGGAAEQALTGSLYPTVKAFIMTARPPNTASSGLCQAETGIGHKPRKLDAYANSILTRRSIPKPGVVARQCAVAHRLISLSTCSLLPPAFDMFPVFLVIYSGPALSRCCRSRLLSVRCGRPIREIVDILITAQFIPRYCILLIMASQAHRVSIAETDVASFVTLLHDRS